MEKLCLVCGVEVKRYKDGKYLDKNYSIRTKYCSIKCRGIASRGKRKSNEYGEDFIVVSGYGRKSKCFLDGGDIEQVLCRYWVLSKTGYVCSSSVYSRIYLHRFLLGMHKFHKNEVVDHIDRDPLNNRRNNLRVVDHASNIMNNGSKNIYKSKGGYYSKVGNTYLGHFKTAERAEEISREYKEKFINAVKAKLD